MSNQSNVDNDVEDFANAIDGFHHHFGGKMRNISVKQSREKKELLEMIAWYCIPG